MAESTRVILRKPKVGIIGNGYVGQAYAKFFKDAHIYSRTLEREGKITKGEINSCDLAIVCVPTPMNENGSVNLEAIYGTLDWLETPLILIKSTIPPGTTKALKKRFKKRICHSPEYVGEGGYFIPFWLYPHPTEPIYHDFMIIGGNPQDREDILQFFYPVLGATKVYYQVDETTSELIKYMENAAIASKVTLCNEFYNIAAAFGVNYSQVREGFVLDKRQGTMFTIVYKNRRGFDGKCLPKDINGIIDASTKAGYDPEFLRDVWKNNKRIRGENGEM